MERPAHKHREQGAEIRTRLHDSPQAFGHQGIIGGSKIDPKHFARLFEPDREATRTVKTLVQFTRVAASLDWRQARTEVTYAGSQAPPSPRKEKLGYKSWEALTKRTCQLASNCNS